MIEGAREVSSRRAQGECLAGRRGIELIEVDAIGAKRGGEFDVGLGLVIVDAQVVEDGAKPFDDAVVLFDGLSRVSLANEVGQERLHPLPLFGARGATSDERLGAAGRLDRLDPGDRSAPAARAISRFSARW